MQSFLSKQYTDNCQDEKVFACDIFVLLNRPENVSHPTNTRAQMPSDEQIAVVSFRFVSRVQPTHPRHREREGEKEKLFVLPENLFQLIVRFPFWTFDKFWQIYLDCAEKFVPPSKTTATDVYVLFLICYVIVSRKSERHRCEMTNEQRHWCKLNNSHVHFSNGCARQHTHTHTYTIRQPNSFFAIEWKSTQCCPYSNDSPRQKIAQNFLKFDCFESVEELKKFYTRCSFIWFYQWKMANLKLNAFQMSKHTAHHLTEYYIVDTYNPFVWIKQPFLAE